MHHAPNDVLRRLPSVSGVIRTEGFRTLEKEYGSAVAKFELRALLGWWRTEMVQGTLAEVPGADALISELGERLVRLVRPEGRAAINATGILLHTGLGRAPLCREALEALDRLGRYSLLQLDLEHGSRGLREAKIERLLVELTGCEAACVVNNNAAATMLILNTMAPGREVIISRGQLVEIGGSFRLPEVMAQSSARLREVGTTNRTHVHDYERAISEETGAIMHVHTSNYRIRGFVGVPSLAELVELAHSRNVLVIDDLGSGALVPLAQFGLPDEPLVKDSVAAGTDLCCFSGDKLISGPQAGIIVGRRVLVDRIRKNPFARMFRVCKLTVAALEATLCHFLDGSSFRNAIPLYRMLGRNLDELETQAKRLVSLLPVNPELSAEIVDHTGYIGSGSVPDQGIGGRAVSVRHRVLSVHDLARRLRRSIPAVLGHIDDNALLLDMRTVGEDEVNQLASCVKNALF